MISAKVTRLLLKAFWQLLAIFLFVFLLTPRCVLAVEPKFAVSYNISHKVNVTGITTVNQEVTLRNLTSEYYATEYTSKIGRTKLSNLRAYDSSGPLKIELKDNKEEKELRVFLQEQSVGIGRTSKWTLVYDTPEIARKNGQIWDISIPQPSNLETIDGYVVSLTVPASFGKPQFLKPLPSSYSSAGGQTFFWSKDFIVKSGIFAAFGSAQTYNLNLKYHLYNPKLYPTTTVIALPPDTTYQKIFMTNIEPKPVDVTTDLDGNWLAKYLLAPTQKIDVAVSLSAQVHSLPIYSGYFSPDTQQYLAARQYWEVEDIGILRKATELKTPQAIYQFVSSSLSYDSDKLLANPTRLGGRAAMESPTKAICMEFTDLFISLSRAAKIPAREINGYAFTQNDKRQPVSLKKDILHAWPEYFDQESKKWVMVDPTWENTTGGIDYFNQFDFNHITFAIHGLSSTEPYPAGTYKSEPDTKDVEVSFGQTPTLQNPEVAISTTFPKYLTSGLATNGYLEVKNIGGVFFPAAKIILSINPGFTISPQEVMVNFGLPPFANKRIPVTIEPKGLTLSSDSQLIVSVGNKSYSQEIYARPIYQQFSKEVIIATAAVIILVIGSFFTAKIIRNLLLRRQKQ